MDEEFNPYTAPQTEARPENLVARAIRLENLRMESHVKAVGVVFFFFGLWSLLTKCMIARMAEREFGVPLWRWSLALPCVLLMAGIGLCRLRRWGWMLAIFFYGYLGVMRLYGASLGGNIAAVIQEIAGLLIVAMVLMFLLLRRTRRIFASAYKEILKVTPELRSSVASWGVVVALLVALSMLCEALGIVSP